MPTDEEAIGQDLLIDGLQHVQPRDAWLIASA
jgi:hypothetical protein